MRCFSRLFQTIRKFNGDKSGVTAIEYGLIVVGIALVIILSVRLVGDGLGGFFGDLAVSVAEM
jgi:Flp pilus assembly pilin Flp